MATYSHRLNILEGVVRNLCSVGRHVVSLLLKTLSQTVMELFPLLSVHGEITWVLRLATNLEDKNIK